MSTTATLIFYTLYGSIGVGYFVYGKRQQKFMPIVAGAGLVFFPYFVSDIRMMIAVGLALIAAPFLLRF